MTVHKKLLKRIKKFLLSPTKAFKAEAKTKLEESFKYGLVGLAVMGLLSGLIALVIPMAALPFAGATAFIAIFVVIIVLGFIGLLINGLWLHLWAYIFGARKGLTQTLKVIFYSNTPNYYLGWIPLFGFIAGIWTIVLSMIGLIQLQKLSTARAIGAVLISIIIPLIIVVGIVLWAMASAAPALETPTGMFSFF